LTAYGAGCELRRWLVRRVWLLREEVLRPCAGARGRELTARREEAALRAGDLRAGRATRAVVRVPLAERVRLAGRERLVVREAVLREAAGVRVLRTGVARAGVARTVWRPPPLGLALVLRVVRPRARTGRERPVVPRVPSDDLRSVMGIPLTS
jgi:hypothetical protein